jgi:hypothetical protein
MDNTLPLVTEKKSLSLKVLIFLDYLCLVYIALYALEVTKLFVFGMFPPSKNVLLGIGMFIYIILILLFDRIKQGNLTRILVTLFDISIVLALMFIL